MRDLLPCRGCSHSNAYVVPDGGGEEGTEPKGKALDVNVNFHLYPQLWSCAMGSDGKSEIADIRSQNGVFTQGGRAYTP